MGLVLGRLGSALALCLLAVQPTAAQHAPPGVDPAAPLPDLPEINVDPAAPLPDLPEINVDWPEPPPVDVTAGGEKATGAAFDGTMRYRIDTRGLDRVGLEARFRALSALEASGTAENVAQLDRRARADAELIGRLLRAAGYYGGTVTYAIIPVERSGERTTVRLTVEPGERYLLEEIEVALAATGPHALARDLLGLHRGEPVDSAVIENAESRLIGELRQRGYPFARLGQRDLIVDHNRGTATYRLPLVTGPRARFGSLRLEDRKLMQAAHVARIARFAPGALYDARLVEDLRRALVATGLFASVTLRAVETGAAVNGDAVVDIVVATQAAPPRTIAGQAGYSTGEGIRVEASWQHRALVRPEGALTLRGIVGTQEQRLAGELRFSNFRSRDNSLALSTEASHEDRAAYEARSFTLSGRLERATNLIWQKTWTYSLGAGFIATDETDRDIERNISRRRTFLIGALPATLAYDSSDDLLDPRRGVRLAGRLSPELSFQNSAFGYLRAQLDVSGYLPLSGNAIVAATRVRLGSIIGARRDRLAPSRRFYAGGGGSVRGFGYQDIGPRDAFNDPIGGRSLTEIAAEVRFRVFGEFGIVPFIDGGQLYTTALPSFDSLRVGAGIGVRYYSSFGPIRVDVATPLNPQPGDDKFGVYVSIGQAF